MARMSFNCDTPACLNTITAEIDAEVEDLTEIACTVCAAEFVVVGHVYRVADSGHEPLGDIHVHQLTGQHSHRHEGDHDHEEEEAVAKKSGKKSDVLHDGGEAEHGDG